MIDLPSPVEHGWIIKEGSYELNWHEGEVAPAHIMQTVFCSCKKSKCITGRGSCTTAKLACTELCSCSDCENNTVYREEAAELDTDSEEESMLDD